jgi:hypothetical protein
VIGQELEDEIFRVFAKQHSEVQIIPTSASTAVRQMIQRAISAPDAPTNPLLGCSSSDDPRSGFVHFFSCLAGPVVANDVLGERLG